MFVQVFGYGCNFNTFWVMIERRVPPAKLGQSMASAVATANVFAMTPPMVAYLPNPIPYIYSMIVLLIGISISVWFLPSADTDLVNRSILDESSFLSQKEREIC